VKRNLAHIEKQLETVPKEVLSVRQQQRLETIKALYAQQEAKYRTKNNVIPERMQKQT
jgi:hypothetical protein